MKSNKRWFIVHGGIATHHLLLSLQARGYHEQVGKGVLAKQNRYQYSVLDKERLSQAPIER